MHGTSYPEQTTTDTEAARIAGRRIERLPDGKYLVVHPLDDVAEHKCDTENLAYAPMTPMVRWSLIALRSYLILMTLMVIYRCLQLTRVIS